MEYQLIRIFGIVCTFMLIVVILNNNSVFEYTVFVFLSFKENFQPPPLFRNISGNVSETHSAQNSSFSKIFLVTQGRLGNVLFQYASLYGIAEDLNFCNQT